MITTKSLLRHLFTSSTAIQKLSTQRLPSNMAFRCSPSTSHYPRPLVLLFGWMFSTDAQLDKYRDFWTGRGFDTLSIRTSPVDFFLLGTGRNGRAVIRFLSTAQPRPYSSILFHSFSVGTFASYAFVHQLAKAVASRKPKAREIQESLCGLIFDSIAYEDSPNSAAHYLSPHSPTIQSLVRRLVTAYHRATYPITGEKYRKIGRLIAENPLKLPTLVLYSQDDPISNADHIDRLITAWRSSGITVRSKRWNHSPHVLHYKHHPAEYTAEVESFVREILQLPVHHSHK